MVMIVAGAAPKPGRWMLWLGIAMALAGLGLPILSDAMGWTQGLTEPGWLGRLYGVPLIFLVFNLLYASRFRAWHSSILVLGLVVLCYVGVKVHQNYQLHEDVKIFQQDLAILLPQVQAFHAQAIDELKTNDRQMAAAYERAKMAAADFYPDLLLIPANRAKIAATLDEVESGLSENDAILARQRETSRRLLTAGIRNPKHRNDALAGIDRTSAAQNTVNEPYYAAIRATVLKFRAFLAVFDENQAALDSKAGEMAAAWRQVAAARTELVSSMHALQSAARTRNEAVQKMAEQRERAGLMLRRIISPEP